MTPPRLAYTVVYVADLDATLRFYERAVGAVVRYVHESGQYAELETGPVTLAFTQDELSITALDDLPGGYCPNRPDQPPAGVDLAFATDDVHAAFATAVAAGATPVSMPKVKPWGQTVGYLRDLNGVLFELGTPIDTGADRPSAPA